MPGNWSVDHYERFETLAADVAYLSQIVRELRELTAAAREVTYQRYHSDPNGTFVKDFPTVGLAIFELANLVGTPTKRARLSCARER
jgi:hypothetical protein